jgi:hypothetical protein
MTVSWYCVRGGRSFPQSKNGLMTMFFGLVPRHVAFHGLAVGVEQQLRRGAALAAPRVVGAVDAVAIALAGADRGQVTMPDEAIDFGQVDP